jgi:adenylylsulfate kinase-like enzyme
MTETTTTTIGDGRTTVSEEIEAVLRKANNSIDRIDGDPIIRLALARVTIRTFTREMVGSHRAGDCE